MSAFTTVLEQLHNFLPEPWPNVLFFWLRHESHFFPSVLDFPLTYYRSHSLHEGATPAFIILHRCYCTRSHDCPHLVGKSPLTFCPFPAWPRSSFLLRWTWGRDKSRSQVPTVHRETWLYCLYNLEVFQTRLQACGGTWTLLTLTITRAYRYIRDVTVAQ